MSRPAKESRMRKSLEMIIRNAERMTTESDSNGKESAKELTILGFPAGIRSFDANLSIVFSTFSVFTPSF
jgi:hypothetical protein